MTSDAGYSPVPPDKAYEVIDTLFATDITDPDAAETLRLSYCPVCRETNGRPEEERYQRCDGERCGLRRPAQLLQDFQQIYRSWQYLMVSTDRGLQDAALFTLNSYIWQSAALMPGISRLPNSRFTLGHMTGSLRAKLFSSLLLLVSQTGGDVIMNISDSKAESSERHLSIARRTYRAIEEMEEARHAAAVFERNGRNEAKTAAELGIDRKLLRKRLVAAGVKRTRRYHRD